MSIPMCRKRGCGSTEPTRFSGQYGYLCKDCFNALVTLGATTEIEFFLMKPADNREASEAYFEHVFKEID